MSMPELTRTTIDKAFDKEALLPNSGIYILAYMGKVIYVGKATRVAERLRSHCATVATKNLAVDDWLQMMEWDYVNVRLDILEVPSNVTDEFSWLKETEAACIHKFSPLMNDQLNV